MYVIVGFLYLIPASLHRPTLLFSCFFLKMTTLFFKSRKKYHLFFTMYVHRTNINLNNKLLEKIMVGQLLLYPKTVKS